MQRSSAHKWVGLQVSSCSSAASKQRLCRGLGARKLPS